MSVSRLRISSVEDSCIIIYYNKDIIREKILKISFRVFWLFFNCGVGVSGLVWVKGPWSFFILCSDEKGNVRGYLHLQAQTHSFFVYSAFTLRLSAKCIKSET